MAAQEPFPTNFDRPALAAWVQAETNMSLRDVVSVGATDVIALSSVERPQTLTDGVLRVTFRSEVLSAKIAQDEGYRSWTAVIDVNCAKPAVKVVEVTNYSERNLRGQSRPAAVTDDWLTPPAGSQLYNLTRAACDADYVRPFAGLKVAAASPPPRPAAAVTVAEKAEPASAIAPAARSAPASGVVVQVAAAPSRDQALAALSRVKARFGEGMGLTDDVQTVDLDGKRFYRARLGGFASVDSAKAFCQTLKAGSQDCFVRQAAH
ncbi:SPOR domain-containing protein [Phenylobacterium sp.]|uniref:SPOR domain-containing protein n=1 Tax=Phenylobacterium sp. TaxID=1871053 RepID=UPI0035B357F4